MADQAKSSGGGGDATYGGEPRYAPDEVVVTIDKLFEMTERWAAMMICGELADLPAFLVQLAAHWRRVNLAGPATAMHDFRALAELRTVWIHEVFNPDGSLKPLPPDEDLAVYICGHRDFVDRSQTPPRLLDEGAMEARRARIAAGTSR